MSNLLAPFAHHRAAFWQVPDNVRLIPHAGCFVVEASTLNLRPGQWPQSLVLPESVYQPAGIEGGPYQGFHLVAFLCTDSGDDYKRYRIGETIIDVLND